MGINNVNLVYTIFYPYIKKCTFVIIQVYYKVFLSTKNVSTLNTKMNAKRTAE